jgi:CheY-like chemotaxis protein
VFDRFSQEDSSSTRAYGGLGMGLAIVRYIIEMHGGTVRALSEGEDKGATFVISIPILDRQATQHTPLSDAHLQHEAIASHPAELDGLKLLVVDDESDTCKMIAAAFRKCGSIVRTAERSTSALDVMDEWLPDIMIADINMPDIDGYQLIHEVRSRTPECGGKMPAVALTAMARIEDRVKALSAGYQMHVAKPVEISELRTIVASLANVVVKEHV